jgi:hypothetical protein
LTEAKKGAARLLGCYRTGDANDPETYIAGVVAVLSRYDIPIIREITEPATGIASRLKWLPSVSEVRAECDILADRETRRAEREKQIQEQFAARLQITDQRPRKTYEQLQAELAEAGIFIGKQPKNPLDIGAFRTKYGISLAQWDAIPNAK